MNAGASDPTDEAERAFQLALAAPAPWVKESTDRLRREQENEVATARARFPRTWLDYVELDLANDDYIKGLLARRSLVLVYGPSGDGKTFWTIDLVGHAAAELAYRGRRCRGPCLVVYIAAEAGGSIQPRFYALREHRLAESRDRFVPLAVLMRGANLLNAADVESLARELRTISEEAGLPIGIVVFDTLSRSTAGGDENRAEDMTLAIGAADRIRDEFAATSIFVHHSGKDSAKGARGHSSLYAAADTVIAVAERVATVEKSRNGMSGEKFAFDLDVVQLGHDEDGDQITTCVVRHIAEPAAQRKTPSLTASEQVCLDALRAAIADAGEPLPQTSALPGGVRGAKVAAWRGTFQRKYAAAADGRSDDATNKAFQRANVALQAKGFIRVSDPWAWLS